MLRTQIYLTEREKQALSALADERGKSQSELIREAIDDWIGRSKDNRRKEVLDRTAGMWKDRDDLPEWGDLRQSWERQTD